MATTTSKGGGSGSGVTSRVCAVEDGGVVAGGTALARPVADQYVRQALVFAALRQRRANDLRTLLINKPNASAPTSHTSHYTSGMSPSTYQVCTLFCLQFLSIVENFNCISFAIRLSGRKVAIKLIDV